MNQVSYCTVDVSVILLDSPFVVPDNDATAQKSVDSICDETFLVILPANTSCN